MSIKKIWVGIGVCGLLASCQQEDLYDPTTYQQNYFVQDIPADFDWATTTQSRLIIRVNDLYQGAYLYQVEAYDANPLYHSDANCYGKGVAGKDQDCQMSCDLPVRLSSVFIKQIAPNGAITVTAFDLNAGTTVCDLSPVDVSEKDVSTTERRNVLAKTPTFNVPSNAVILNQNTPSPYTLQPNTNYWIKESYDGAINFSWEGSNLYVSGQWTVRNTDVLVQRTSSVYVLDGGEVVMPQAVNWTCNQDGSLYIASGAVFNTTNQSAAMTFTNNGEFYNAGSCRLSKLTFQSSPSFINEGDMAIASFQITGSNSPIVNSAILNTPEFSANNANITNRGTWTVQSFKTEQGTLNNTHFIQANSAQIKRTQVDNSCSMRMDDLLLEQGKYELQEGALLEAARSTFDGAHLFIYDHALLRVSELFKTTAQANQFDCKGKVGALIQAKKMELNGWNAVHFHQNLYIESDEIIGQAQNNHAHWAKIGQSGFEIAGNECNGSGNSGSNIPPVNPQFPITSEITAIYTFLMEDNFPHMGDYDMNDLVITLNSQKLEKNQENLVSAISYRMNVRAVGATRQLGLAIAFESLNESDVKQIAIKGIGANERSNFSMNEKGLEQGVSKVVVPVFQSAHALFGLPVTQMINTYKEKSEFSEIPFEVELTFNEPIDESKLSVKTMNIFTIVGATNAGKRNEVHLPGFDHTEKCTISPTVVESTKNYMWALLLPGKVTLSKERVGFKNTYPQFESWVQSNKTTNTDWYLYPAK